MSQASAESAPPPPAPPAPKKPLFNLTRIIGLIVLFVSYLIIFAGGLYAGNRSTMYENVEGSIAMLQGGSGFLYLQHLIVIGVLFFLGTFLMEWGNCLENFTNFVHRDVYSPPSSMMMENFTGGVAKLNHPDGYQPLTVEGRGMI